jgi:hypothetical protein
MHHCSNKVCASVMCTLLLLLLLQVFRQKDVKFVSMLDDVRYGRNGQVSVPIRCAHVCYHKDARHANADCRPCTVTECFIKHSVYAAHSELV